VETACASTPPTLKKLPEQLHRIKQGRCCSPAHLPCVIFCVICRHLNGGQLSNVPSRPALLITDCSRVHTKAMNRATREKALKEAILTVLRRQVNSWPRLIVELNSSSGSSSSGRGTSKGCCMCQCKQPVATVATVLLSPCGSCAGSSSSLSCWTCCCVLCRAVCCCLLTLRGACWSCCLCASDTSS
jgi:hypothetical protein